MANPSNDTGRPPRRKRRLIRRLLITLLAIGVVVVLLATALQTPFAKRRIARFIENNVSSAIVDKVEIGEITGTIPFNFAISTVTLWDEGERWLVAHDISVELASRPLLQRRVHVESLSSELVELLALPVGEEDDEEPWKLPELPQLPRWLRVDRALVEELRVSDAVAAEAGRFTARAHFIPDPSADDIDIEAHLERLDAATTHADVVVRLAQDDLTLRADVSDSVFLPELLDVDDPFRFELEGSGPLSQWDGALLAHLGDATLAQATATLRANNGTQFESEGAVNLLPALVPQTVRDQLGSELRLAVAGSLSQEGQLTLQNALVESDIASVAAGGTTHLEERTLSGTLRIHHDNLREFVALGGSEPVPIDLATEIEGSWTQQTWTMTADVAGDRSGTLDGRTTLDSVLALAVSGELRVPKRLVADEYRDLTDEPVLIAVEATYDQATGALNVPEIDLGNQWARLNAQIDANPTENTFAAGAQVQLVDATLLNEVLAADFAVTGVANFNIDGSPSGTTAYLEADLSDLRLEDVQIPRVTAQADISAGPWPDNLFRGLRGEVQASTAGMIVDGRELPPVRLAIAADQAAGETVRISRLRLTDDRFTLTGEGTIAEDGSAAAMALNLDVPDVEPYAQIVDQPYAGSLNATADITFEEGRDVPWRGSVEAALRQPAGFPGAVLAVLRPETSLAADFGYDGERFLLSELDAASEDWRLSGQGSYAPADQRFDARGQLELREIEVANARTSGSIGISASGTADAFESTADVQLTNLVMGEFAVDSVSGAVLASGAPDDVQVTAQFTAETAGEQLNADAVARYTGATIDMSELAVISGANTIQGQLQWNLESQIGEGALALNVPELDQIGRVLEEPLQGELTGDVVLAGSANESMLTLDLAIENFGSEFATLEEADVNGTVRDPFGDPVGSMEAQIQNLVAASVQTHFTVVSAEFSGDRVDVDATASGLVRETIPFETNLQAAWRFEESTGIVSSLEGTLEEYAFALAEPAQVRLAEGGVVLEPAQLQFGGGLIEARADVAEDALAANAVWNDLPLEVGRLVGLPFTAGTLAGSITLTGTPDRPVGQATVEIANAQTPIMTEQGDLAADLRIESELTTQSLALRATLDMPQNAHAGLNVTLPVVPAEQTVYAIDESGPWSGELTANLDLATLPRLTGLDQHQLAGQATANFVLAGSVSDPSFEGALRIDSGTYENAEFGTILRDIEAELRGANNRVELVAFRATDPSGGTVTAEGGIEFADLTNFEHRFTTTLSEARLVHRDDFTGRVNGELAFAGDEEASELSGTIDVLEANVILRPAPDLAIPELEVAVVNAPITVEEDDEAAAAFTDYPVRLDIEVSMPGRVFVQAPDLFTEWDGTVHVGGTLDAPQFTGQIAPIRGYVSFLGRRFELQRESSISVDTEESPSPYLNLVAVTSRDNLTATLFIRGTLDELSIEITSEPALPREEILARVLFGKNLTEISPVQALQLARAVAMFSGTLEGVPFFSGPSRLPVIDTFDVETGGEGGPTVSVGKYLSEDIFVELEQGAGTESSRANVEFEVTPHVSVESSIGADTQGGVGVFWKYDY